MATSQENFRQELNDGLSTTEGTKVCVIKILDQIKRFQGRIRKHVEDNYVGFMPNHTTSDMFIEEGEVLLRETEHLFKNVGSDAKIAFNETNTELSHCVHELCEASLGIRISNRVLKIDDLFQCVENAKASKDYLMVLDLLGKLNYLIFSDSSSDIDCLFQKCDCYDTIKVKYHIQSSILKQNLQQRFDRLVQFSVKSFPCAKNVTLQVSKDVSQLQDTVLALFQSHYNPIKICDFLMENCLVPMVTKPISVEYSIDNVYYSQLNISYSLKEFGKSLRPSYKDVFMHIKSLLDFLSNINVNVTAEQHVFTIIGNHVKEPLLKTIVRDCLMHAIPDTMDEYLETTLIDDVVRFEQMLVDTFFIEAGADRDLSEFTQKFDILFKHRFSRKVLETARDIMQKGLQDMVTIAEGNTVEEVAKSPVLFPQCMISKSTLELVKLMEHLLRQPMDTTSSVRSDADTSIVNVIPIILNSYINNVPKIHEKLLESIPQQAALFYNNCMYLAHWITQNSECGIPTHPALIKTLQATGAIVFKDQVLLQQKILKQLLKEFDFSDTYSIGSETIKLLRQCLRQMDLLKNVWLLVLPDNIYNVTFTNLLNDFCQDIIKHILSLEDISATVAGDLSELIEVILCTAPNLFKEKHNVLCVPCWTKLQELKNILNASLHEITEQWCDGAGILTVNYKAEEIRHLIRALFQNTDRRAKALARIV